MAKYDPGSRRPSVAQETSDAAIDEILSTADPAVDAATEQPEQPATKVELVEPAESVEQTESVATEVETAEVVDLRTESVEHPPVTVVVEQSTVEPVPPPDRRLLRTIAIAGAVATALGLLVAWRRSQRSS